MISISKVTENKNKVLSEFKQLEWIEIKTSEQGIKFLKNVSQNKIPMGESLKNTYDRVVPYYKNKIEPLIFLKKNVLIVFHGNSCRSLLMKIFNISKEKISDFEIPTGNPLLIKFENSEVKEYKYHDTKRSKKILFNT